MVPSSFPTNYLKFSYYYSLLLLKSNCENMVNKGPHAQYYDYNALPDI